MTSIAFSSTCSSRESRTRGMHRTSVHVRKSYPWSQRTSIALLGLALCSVHPSAWAGDGPQGSSIQGSSIQGSSIQGSSIQGTVLQTTWLQGPELVGWLSDGSHMKIIGFAGDVVYAIDLDIGASPPPVLSLHPTALVGMVWTSPVCDETTCINITYHIVQVEQDDTDNTMPMNSSNDDIWLYEIKYTAASNPGPGDWYDACESSGGAPTLGMFVDGRWAMDGTWNQQGYTFSCPSGVVAKCARGWGYKPWKTLVSQTHGAVSLQPLHQACTRAARADYCGSGVSHTLDGTLIDIFDIYGFNVQEALQGYVAEAKFDQGGALEVHQTRVAQEKNVHVGWDFPACRSSFPSRDPDTTLLEVWSNPAFWAGN